MISLSVLLLYLTRLLPAWGNPLKQRRCSLSPQRTYLCLHSFSHSFINSNSLHSLNVIEILLYISSYRFFFSTPVPLSYVNYILVAPPLSLSISLFASFLILSLLSLLYLNLWCYYINSFCQFSQREAGLIVSYLC